MRRPKLEILAQEDVLKIIEAAYDLLENFGVKVYNQEALEILADGGAKVDFKKRVSFIPQAMVDKALASVPSSFSIFNHEGQNPAVLEKDRVHFSAGSVALNILDSETEKIRKPKLLDLIRITSLIETLENLSFVTGSVLPDDIPEQLIDAYRYYLIMLNTSKPLFSGAFSVEGLRVQIEMLSVLRGGMEKLRLASCHICS